MTYNVFDGTLNYIGMSLGSFCVASFPRLLLVQLCLAYNRWYWQWWCDDDDYDGNDDGDDCIVLYCCCLL